MANLLPTNFPIPQESAIATYSFVDFLNNQGFLTLYLAGIEETGNNFTQILTTDSDFKSALDYRYISSSGSPDLDFDITVNKNILINGAYAYGTIAYSTSNSGDSAVVTITLSKFDGSTETQIAQEVLTLGITGTGGKYVSFRMLCAETLVKFGEVIRLSISYTSPSTSYLIHFDPSAREAITEVTSGATIGGNSSVSIPVKLDL